MRSANMPGFARASSYSTVMVSATGFTTADETPGISLTTCSKPIAHDAQSAPRKMSFSVAFCFMALLRDLDLAVIHIHAAGKNIFAYFFWLELHRQCLIQRQMSADPEIGQNNFFLTIARICAIKIECDGLSLFDHDDFG